MRSGRSPGSASGRAGGGRTAGARSRGGEGAGLPDHARADRMALGHVALEPAFDHLPRQDRAVLDAEIDADRRSPSARARRRRRGTPGRPVIADLAIADAERRAPDLLPHGRFGRQQAQRLGTATTSSWRSSRPRPIGSSSSASPSMAPGSGGRPSWLRAGCILVDDAHGLARAPSGRAAPLLRARWAAPALHRPRHAVVA